MKRIPEHLVEFAEEIASIRHNPDCKACRNKELKGVEGIIIVPKGSVVDTARGRMVIATDTKLLKVCCGKMGPSDSQRLAEVVNAVMEQHAALLFRVSFFGFFIYLVRVVLGGDRLVEWAWKVIKPWYWRFRRRFLKDPRCCERDTNRDGNCDQHPAKVEPPKKP